MAIRHVICVFPFGKTAKIPTKLCSTILTVICTPGRGGQNLLCTTALLIVAAAAAADIGVCLRCRLSRAIFITASC